jgi:hypothetical protein
VKTKVGLWIDHRKAVVVTITDAGEETKQITSHMEKHVRFSGGGSEVGTADDMADRKFDNHLDKYYDRVIAYLHEAESIQIFGPGEAKHELETRLEHAGLKEHIVEVDAADKMTDRQIAAKVRERFLK